MTMRFFRPWGYFDYLTATEKYVVKLLTILPGQAISLQEHEHRSEHWTIVEGEGHVIRGTEHFFYCAPSSITIPPRIKHRIENKGTRPLVVVEVQTGDYLGEDDITRYDDRYKRK